MKEDTKKDTKKSILIAVPNLGTVRTELSAKLIEFSHHPDYRVRIWEPQNLIPLDYARNKIRKEFLAGDFDYLLSIDADIGPPSNLLDLVALDLDVVAPIGYIMKKGEILPMALEKTNDGWEIIKEIPPNSLLAVDCAAAGCLIIARRVLEKVGLFRFSYDDDGMIITDEGFVWNEEVIEAGFKIFVHTGYQTDHWKTVNLTEFVKNQNMLRYLQEIVYEKDRIIMGNIYSQARKVKGVTISEESQPKPKIVFLSSSTPSVSFLKSIHSKKYDCQFLVYKSDSKIMAAKRNDALKQVEDADFVGFYDPQIIIITANFLDRLMDGFYSDEVAAVAPSTDEVIGLQNKNINSQNVFQKCPFLISFFSIYRKSVLDKIGSFDGFGYAREVEDLDYSFRIREEGFSLINVRDLYVKRNELDFFSFAEGAAALKTMETIWGTEKLRSLFTYASYLMEGK